MNAAQGLATPTVVMVATDLAAEARSGHPLAEAVLDELQRREVPAPGAAA